MFKMLNKKIPIKENFLEKECDYSLHRVSRFIQPSLLLFLSKKPSYGYELIEKLKTLGFHNESVDVGAVYRILRKLEKERFIKSYWEKSKIERKKRIYHITDNGKRLLALWVERIKERRQALNKFIKIYQQEIKNRHQ